MDTERNTGVRLLLEVLRAWATVREEPVSSLQSPVSNAARDTSLTTAPGWAPRVRGQSRVQLLALIQLYLWALGYS